MYQQSLHALVEQQKEQPKQMQLVAGDFRFTMEGYRRVAKRLGEEDDESLKPILELIEKSKPRSLFPLLEVLDLNDQP